MDVLRSSVLKGNRQPAPVITPAPEWRVSTAPVPYQEALDIMADRTIAIASSRAPELVWLLEHPPLYTAGRSAKARDLLQARFPVHDAGRGGEYTYHGPGQRVAYVMLDLNNRGRDLRAYVRQLEDWGVAALAQLGVTASRREGEGDRRVGLWVDNQGRDEKIAALGVRISRWVTSHGIAINVNPDLSHYNGIVPCGISQHGVTSLAALGSTASMNDLDATLRASWADVFG